MSKQEDLAAALALAAQALNNVANAMKAGGPALPAALRRSKPRTMSNETPVAAPAEPPVPRPADLRERLEIALTRESLDTTRLSKALGEPIDKVEALVRTLRGEGKIANVGMGDNPIWSWKIGNDTDTVTLRKVVRRLISERGMYLRDLVAATGAKESRVSGVMIELQRVEKIQDVSGGGHAKCYLLVSAGSHMTSGEDPGAFRDARLRPRGTTRAARAAKK